jgi:thioredoxin
MAGSNVTEITAANFQSEVLKSDKPVLVDFWAPWCAPCRRIAPMIDELATEYAGAVKVGKLNVSENEETNALAGSYAVENIPTLIIFKGGEPVQRFVGLPGKTKIQEALDAARG